MEAGEPFEGRVVVPPACGGEEAQIESLPHHRGPAQKLLVIEAEPAHPGEKHLLNRPRQTQRPLATPAARDRVEPPRLDRVADELLNREGVTSAHADGRQARGAAAPGSRAPPFPSNLAPARARAGRPATRPGRRRA